MEGPEPKFICICPQKTLYLGDKEEGQRKQEQKVAEAIKSLPGESIILSGGGIVVVNGTPGEGAGYAAACSGRIDNHNILTQRHLAENYSQNWEKAETNLSCAELLCQLYKLYGRTLPQKLKGNFCFVLYDPVQGRVLAAASPSSSSNLIQARGPDNSLIISNYPFESLPDNCHSVIPIPPGFVKYGWSSEPQRYALPREPRENSSGQLQPASASAFPNATAASLVLNSSVGPADASGSSGVVQTSGPSFAESENSQPASPAPKKTRRGKRAGRNQKLRAEQHFFGRVSGEFSRHSLDGTSAGSLLSPNSFSSRADEQSWWRTNTPRNSLDLRPSNSESPGGAEGGPQPFRRKSLMSAGAAPFVPSGLFSRHSVPAVLPRASALQIGAASSCPPASATATSLLASGAQQVLAADSPIARPSHGCRETSDSPGKADAAWEEEPGQTAQEGSGSQDPAKCAESIADGSKQAGSGADVAASSHQASHFAAATASQLPRLRADEQRSSEDGGVRGLSPGGSPRRPPKAPRKGPFRHFLAVMVAKRSTNPDPKSEGGFFRRARSSSHGNLVDLEANTGLWDSPQSGYSSGSEGAKQSYAKKMASDFQQHVAALQKLQEEKCTPAGQTSAASWIAQKTRSLFGKSKSCTALSEMERSGISSQCATPEVEVQ